MLKIYGSDFSAPANKVRFAANALGLDYEYKAVDMRAGEHLSPEHKKLHPAGKVPVIDDGGFVLFESNAILRYLAEKTGSALYPKDLQRRALVDQWMEFTTIHVGAAVGKVMYNRVFAPVLKQEPDERSIEDGLKFLTRFLPLLDERLAAHSHLAGETMTLADLCLLAALDPCGPAKIDLSPYAALTRRLKEMKKKDFYAKCFKDFADLFHAAA